MIHKNTKEVPELEFRLSYFEEKNALRCRIFCILGISGSITVGYTDAGLENEAIKVYYDLLKVDPKNAQAHSNLGTLFVSQGDFESALKHYDKSIEIEPNNYFSYVNRANYYFRKQENDNAIKDAEQALKLKNNGVEAASLLTVIYALQGDEENKKKYYHISIISGKDPQDLNEAIEYFSNEKNNE